MIKIFRIGYKTYGSKTSSIDVEDRIKCRQINISTYIYALNITLLDGYFRNDRWLLRFLVPVIHHLRFSLTNLLEQLIRTVLITDDVLWSIGAPNLMKFKNKIDQYDISFQEQADLDNLRKAMLDMNITIIENDDIFFDCNDTPDLTMFRYSNRDEANAESAACTKSEFNIVKNIYITIYGFCKIHFNFSPISPPPITTPIRMSDAIQPKLQTFEEWLQGPKSSSKLHVQPI